MAVDIVRTGRPDYSGKLLRGYGTAAIRRYLTDSTLSKADQGNLLQLERSLQRLSNSKSFKYIANDVIPYEGYTKYSDGKYVDPLNAAYIKIEDPEAKGPYNSLLFRVRNPVIVYESDIAKAFGNHKGQPEKRDDALRGIFSDFDGGSGKIKPSVEVALVQRDDTAFTRPSARIRWEWDTRQYKVVTKGHVPGRNDVIPDKISGVLRQEVPIVSFTRMRNGVIIQANS